MYNFQVFSDNEQYLYVYRPPFVVKRSFVVQASRVTRGKQASRRTTEMLVCLAGAIKVTTDDGITKREFALIRPSQGLLLQPMTWSIQEYGNDCTLLVFCDQDYDFDDSIRSYDEFLKEIKR